MISKAETLQLIIDLHFIKRTSELHMNPSLCQSGHCPIIHHIASKTSPLLEILDIPLVCLVISSYNKDVTVTMYWLDMWVATGKGMIKI